MEIEVKNYTYETMPDYSETVEGAKELVMTGEEIGLRYIHDVKYSSCGNVLYLQLIVPEIFRHPEACFPCVVFVQGSAWKEQNLYQNLANLAKLAGKGYVCAIAQYRHSGIAKFPAQVIDIKNAVRFLKSHAEEYGIEKENIAVMGDSSGGHVSCLAGMTAECGLFDEPENKESCLVKGIIDLYGAVDVTMPCGFPQTINHQLPDSPEGMLMGYNIRENREKAKAANAKEYVNQNIPPMLILHGTKDRTVFCRESVDLYRALKAAGRDAEFYFVRNADHGGAAFWTDEAITVYDRFLQRCRRNGECYE